MAIDLTTIEDPTLRRQLTAYLKDSPSSRARREFFGGEPMTRVHMAEHGLHSTALNGYVEEARLIGYAIASDKVTTPDGSTLTEHHVTNPELHDYDEALVQLARARQGASAKKAKAKKWGKAAPRPAPVTEEVVHVTAPAPKAKAKANGKGKSLVHAGHLPFTYITHGDHMLPIPALGANVEVNILKKEPDGTIRVGLMVEGVQWVADITDAVLL